LGGIKGIKKGAGEKKGNWTKPFIKFMPEGGKKLDKNPPPQKKGTRGGKKNRNGEVTNLLLSSKKAAKATETITAPGVGVAVAKWSTAYLQCQIKIAKKFNLWWNNKKS